MELFRNPRSAERAQAGAALLLLLALLGVGAATLLVSALGQGGQDTRHVQTTLARMTEASDALLGFAAAHGRLPRPAISATDGRESPLPCASAESCTGFLPWVTLGVEGGDAWGKLFKYSVTPVYTQRPVLRLAAVADKRVLTRRPDGGLVYLAGQDECSVARPCAPVVLLSHGRNHFGTSVQGRPQASAGAGPDEQGNATESGRFISRVASADAGAAGGAFDDIVRVISLQALYQQMGRAAALP